MIEILRQMIFSVTTAAVFGSVMLSLVQKSALYEITRLTIGMLMILSLLLPISRLQISKPSEWWGHLESQTRTQTATAQARNEEISQQSFATIVSRCLTEEVKKNGIDCMIHAEMITQQDNTWSIDRITVQGKGLTDLQRAQVSRLISKSCGVPASRQFFTEGK